MANRPGERPQFGFGASARRIPPAGNRPPPFVDPNYFSPFKSSFDGLNLARTSAPKTARQIADACRILPDPSRPPLSAAQLDQLRRDIDRAFFMANNPLAGTAYGLATMANASPQSRDAALAVGGVFDAAMLGAAPRGAPVRGSPSPAPRHVETLDLQMPATRSRGVNVEGQTKGVDYAVWPSLLGTGTRAPRRETPPGWQGHGTNHNEARGHLNARNNGGPGDAWNIATITQNPTNSSHMTRFDNVVTRRVRAGEPMQGSAVPFYTPGILPPTIILQTAHGPLGSIANIVRNPAGRPR